MAAVAYLLLKRLRDEKTACLGALLLLFTPVGLAMMQRSYADTFAAAAFLSMGGGLYIYSCLRWQELSRRTAAILLFLAGLGLGASVAANYYNALVVLLFVLHFVFMLGRSRGAQGSRAAIRSLLWMGLGLALPLAGLLVYQDAVFGSPWRFGFQYAQLPVGFSPHFLLPNLKYVTAALVIGFPLLIPGVAALLSALYRKVRLLVERGRPAKSGVSQTGMRWDMLLLLAGWIAAVYGLYLNYEWTADTQVRAMPFISMARYYLPAALPLTVLAALWLRDVPRKLSLAVTILALAWGVIFFAQSALSYPVVPAHSPYNPQASSEPQITNGELYMPGAGIQNGQ
jgi:hypothetical protein